MIEGYYFKLHDNSIFYVKGVIHPPGKVIGFPKYIPSTRGSRIAANGLRYTKLATLNEQNYILNSRYSEFLVYDEHYGCKVPEIPLGYIVKFYNPICKAMEVLESRVDDEVLVDVKCMVKDIIECTGVKCIGVSGSILVGLYDSKSDIDVVVYGVSEGRKVYDYLLEVVPRAIRGYRRYIFNEVVELHRRRSVETPIPLDLELRYEMRKVLEGVFRGREYFIRLIDTSDVGYHNITCRRLGSAVIKARVIDDSKSMFTPCRYGVEVLEHIDGVKVLVDEIYSLRGRFCEIASVDDIVVARGVVEKVQVNGKSYYRLHLVEPGDYLINTSIM